MATANFTIPDAKVPGLAAAIENGVGLEREDKEADKAFIIRYIRHHVKELDYVYRHDQAGSSIVPDEDLISETKP